MNELGDGSGTSDESDGSDESDAPVEMDEAEPCTSSASELVEKRRFLGSRLCQAADSGLPGPSTDGAGAELERRANRRGFVAAKLGARPAGMLWPGAGDDIELLVVRWRAPPGHAGRWAVGDGEWLPGK